MSRADKHATHVKATAAAMEDVESSVLARIGYDSSLRILQVEFRSGRVYQYFDVPSDVHEALRSAESIGGYFNREIRDKYRTAEVGPAMNSE